MWKGISAATATVLLVVVFISCSERVMGPEPTAKRSGPEYLPPTTPENVLENLQTAYEEKDIDGYAACLDPDFVFVPSRSSGMGSSTLDRAEDLQSTRRMFEAVDDIRITLTHGRSTSSTMEHPYAEEDGHRVIDVSNVWIRIVDSDATQDGPLVHEVNGDQARFVFRPIGGTSPIEYQIVCQQEF